MVSLVSCLDFHRIYFLNGLWFFEVKSQKWIGSKISFFGIIAVICTQVIYGALFQGNLCRMKATHHNFRCQSSIFPFEILWAIDLPFWLPLGPHISKCQWSKMYHEDTGGCLRLIITVDVNIVLYMDDKRNWECHCYIWCLKVVFSLYLRWA